jgi:hypothetical protein
MRPSETLGSTAANISALVSLEQSTIEEDVKKDTTARGIRSIVT